MTQNKRDIIDLTLSSSSDNSEPEDCPPRKKKTTSHISLVDEDSEKLESKSKANGGEFRLTKVHGIMERNTVPSVTLDEILAGVSAEILI